jgi:hypothetical protein
MKIYFIEKCKLIGLNIPYLISVTKGLIFGTFYFIKEDELVKESVWKLLKSDLLNNYN